jgi:hypothetical protein
VPVLTIVAVPTTWRVNKHLPYPTENGNNEPRLN